MFEMLLNRLKPLGAIDNSDLPFPAGTPYKGVMRSVNSITASKLSSDIGLTAGGLMPDADQAGWLHFIEDSGYEVLVAKKPLRYAISGQQISQATGDGTKTVTFGGEEWVVSLVSGYKSNPAMLTGTSTAAEINAQTGGEWNRYICGVYDGPYRANTAWPADVPHQWGPYTAEMLGLDPKLGTGNQNNLVNGSLDFTLEYIVGAAVSPARGFTTVTNYPRMLGGVTFANTNNDPSYGWRPVLIKKSTMPPAPPTPYKGVVPSSELITGSALSTAMNFTAGSLLNDTPNWIHLEENGKTYYVCMQSIRNSMTWADLNAASLLTGSRTVAIGNKVYKVRVMTGLDTPTSEWNRWMYFLYDGVNTTNPGLPPLSKRWARFNDAQLAVTTGSNTVPGTFTFIQESSPGNCRGYPGIVSSPFAGSGINAAYGWRPVLEEVVFDPPAPVPDTPYKGFVSSTDLISGDALATAVGLTAGTPLDGNVGWLHFVDPDTSQDVYIARKVLKTNLTVAQFQAAGMADTKAVITPGKSIVINGDTYLVRNMTQLATPTWASVRTATNGGEWNKYILPVYGDSDRLPEWPQWGNFTKEQLGLNYSNGAPGQGCISIGKEAEAAAGTHLIGRGYYYDLQSPPISPLVQARFALLAGESQTISGWRPILIKQ